MGTLTLPELIELYAILLKPICRDYNISLESKVKLMRSLVISIFLYACESWTFTAEHLTVYTHTVMSKSVQTALRNKRHEQKLKSKYNTSGLSSAHNDGRIVPARMALCSFISSPGTKGQSEPYQCVRRPSSINT